ncbi:MAG: hypothetical protein RLZZ458_2571 [Planctomycetota bacterium]|jgi:hypothetical protein
MSLGVFHPPNPPGLRPWAGRLCLLLAASLLPLAAFDAAERERPSEAALAWLVLGISAVGPAFGLRRAASGSWSGGWTRGLAFALIVSLVTALTALLTGVWWWLSFGVLLLLAGIAGAAWRNGSLWRGAVAVLLPGLCCIGLPGEAGAVGNRLALDFCLQTVSHTARLVGILHAVEGGQVLTTGPTLPGSMLHRAAASLPIWLAGCTAVALFQRRATFVLLVHQAIASGLWAMLMIGRGVALLNWPQLQHNRQGMDLWLAPEELPFMLAGTALWLSGDYLVLFVTAPSRWFGVMPDDRRRWNPLTRLWNRLVAVEQAGPRFDTSETSGRGSRFVKRRPRLSKRIRNIFRLPGQPVPAVEGIE